ncbi:hypothetical protein B7R22_18530 [Subtercola boreus]|uniref:Uncharacterized protein n=1 Tax=Subtercola boreus TaxID=120213 RepID=A0A3E0VPR8_9MICO|nr:hypothetical protein B7R22_18530 [Subtercola boreus]
MDLGPHVASFESIFDRLHALSSLNLVVNLSVMAYGSSTGWPLYVGPAVLEDLASVPCGISVDMFNELGWRG